MSSWLEELRSRLPRHAAVLDALVTICASDERIDVLEIQCSIARGAGDELSDLDVGLTARDEDWEGVADALPGHLAAIGGTVDVIAHTIPEWGNRPHRRIFCQYADGLQVDLVVRPTSGLAGRMPGAVVLYDPGEHLADERRPAALGATPDDVQEWEVLGWELLANVAKYLSRGSLWEAHERLHDARAMALRLVAAAEAVPYPGFGLTSLLDAEPPRLPNGLEATVSGIDPVELTNAALATGSLLRRAAVDARHRIGVDGEESPMAAHVMSLLAAGATA
jgi:hypothetical protein